jgi:Peptidase family M41
MQATYDEATAYHEAGHAVLALLLGRPVHQVSILPNRERLGVCVFGKGSARPSADWIEREMLISLGGVAAEARHTGHYAWDAAGRDWQYVHDLAVERGGSRRAPRLVSRLLAKVEHLLSREGHWQVVERVAAELLRRGVLSGRAARHLLEQGGTTC